MALYPFGYAGNPQGMGTLLTIEQYDTLRTIRQLNFEMWRRTRALMIYAGSVGVPLGVGTGWRIQPNPPPPGFASPGNSNHEGFPADGVSGGAVAADMVPAPSWPWMEAHLAAFGLRSFRNVNSEPWHIQPWEIPASRNYRRAPWVLPFFPLPGGGGQPPPNPGYYNPAADQWGLFPIDRNKPTLSWLSGYAPAATVAWQPQVTYFNHVLVFKCRQPIRVPYAVYTGTEADNPATAVGEGGSIWAQRNVRNFFDPNNANRAAAEEAWYGVCGPATWGLIDAIATNFR